MTDLTFHTDKVSPELLKAAMDDFVRAANVISTIKKSIADGSDLPDGFESSVRARAYQSGLMPDLSQYVRKLWAEAKRGMYMGMHWPPLELTGKVSDTQLFQDIFRLSEEAGYLMDTLRATVFQGTPVTPETLASVNWNAE